MSVRGCTVFEMRDEANNILNDINGKPDERVVPAGTKRTIRVKLDTAAYQVTAITLVSLLSQPLLFSYNLFSFLTTAYLLL